jgi:hypothetical protein
MRVLIQYPKAIYKIECVSCEKLEHDQLDWPSFHQSKKARYSQHHKTRRSKTNIDDNYSTTTINQA